MLTCAHVRHRVLCALCVVPRRPVILGAIVAYAPRPLLHWMCAAGAASERPLLPCVLSVETKATWRARVRFRPRCVVSQNQAELSRAACWCSRERRERGPRCLICTRYCNHETMCKAVGNPVHYSSTQYGRSGLHCREHVMSRIMYLGTRRARSTRERRLNASLILLGILLQYCKAFPSLARCRTIYATTHAGVCS